MKVLVTYYSETGNTEKLARAVYEGIQKADKDLLPVHEVQSVENYDLILFGFPVQSSSVPNKVEPFLKNIPKGAKVALFATHGSLRMGQLAVTAFEHAVTLAAQAKVIGTFGCRGKVKSSLIDALMKTSEHKAWAEQARSADGHPDDADFEEAKNFAKEIMKKASSS
jgi:flavodoxin